jgi:hypothetical protein
VTSIRSTAAILAESEDVDPEWRAQFHRNVYEDSIRLSDAADALTAYLDASPGNETGLSSPQEEVEAWLARSGYHIAGLERPHPTPSAALVAGVPELASDAARKLAHVARYRADAEALPLDAFLRALAETGPDPAALAERFGTGLPRVFRRLATLPEGAGPPVGLVVCDASGTLTFRRPAPAFAPPRHGAACPLWPLYAALARPMVPIRTTVEMAGRVPVRFLTYAYAETRFPGGFDGPQVTEALMLVLPAQGPRTGGERIVGAACRICPRAGCVARREPSIVGAGD